VIRPYSEVRFAQIVVVTQRQLLLIARAVGNIAQRCRRKAPDAAEIDLAAGSAGSISGIPVMSTSC
jgi:hypothetical protein